MITSKALVQKVLTVILEAIVAGLVAGPLAEWANCTFFFLDDFGVSTFGLELPANGGKHTTQYVICRCANGATAFLSVETGFATSEGKQR